MFRPTIALLAGLIATAATAQEVAPPYDAAAGHETYLRWCATCHGADARGNGPMAAVLTLQPADLATLAARNDGTFPVARVVRRVDGRDPLVSHGSPMPLFGDFFEGDDVALQAETGQPVLTSRPIAELLTWMRSIQVPLSQP